MTGETDTEIPETGAVFTFGKSKIANNVPSRLWLKNDTPVHISCGQSHSAFVTEQGRLFVFGNNNRGQLGLQTKGPVNKPICVKALKGERAQFVACGADHTLISTSQGEIFAAGGNSDGQLGLGHCNDSISFQRLHPFCDCAPIKLLSAGGHTSAALTEDGRLFLWGDNSVGQIGLGNDSHALLPKELKLGQPIQWVSCGYRHSALVTDNGDVFTFGESADGRLGLSAHQLANHSHPQRVESLHGVLQVACGGKHTLALTEDELYSFGRGEFGQLGLGTLVFTADTPVAVGHFRKGRVTHVTCGENHSALITDSGLLYTFGDGRHGKLGLGDENFTNQFSPAVCQRFFDYSVMTVACGSSHMLVFARPRQQESEEVCLEDEDVTYSYLDRCYTSMLQGQPLEHIPDPAPALVSQPTFLPSSLPTSHRWSLSTRARRRQRESSSAQFGPEFCNLPPLTTGFTALALTGNILQPRSLTDTPKRFKTDDSVESSSTSFTLPARTPPCKYSNISYRNYCGTRCQSGQFTCMNGRCIRAQWKCDNDDDFTPITKSAEDCHSVGTSENSVSKKTHEQNKHSGRVENIPQQAPPTEVQAGSVSHSSVTESPTPSNLKSKKPRSRDPKNTVMTEEHSSATASLTKMQAKAYKKPIQSTNNKSKSQAVEVRLSSDRISAKENEGSSETCSTNIDARDKISKADKHSKVQHADSRGQEVTALAEMEQETKSSPIEIQKIFSRSSPVQEVEQVRTTPTKVQEVKSPKIKEIGIPVRATKRVKSPVKVQDVPSGIIEVSKVESTPQADAQRDIKPSLGNAQEVRSTLIDTQEPGNSTPVKIPAKVLCKEKNDVDTEGSPSERTPKKAKKKRSDVERAPMSETAPKTPGPLLLSIPIRISKAKKGKSVESENSNFQLRQETTEVKRDNDSKIPQNTDISFPPIKNRKSGGKAEKSQSASNLQSDHKNSQSPTDKVLTEQKHEFPSIKSLASERGHSFSSSWSNNQSATNKSSAPKETESLSGKLSPSSSSPQHKQSPLKENKLARKTVEPEKPDRKPQAEQSIMGSVVSSLPAVAIASAAPLLIKAAEVLSQTPPESSSEMFSHASVSKETTGSNILLEQEVDQDSTVQDVSAIEETDDSIIKQQSAQDVQNKLVSNENEMWVSGDEKVEEEEHVKDSETERKEEGGEEESLAEEEDESEGVGQEQENSAVEDEEEVESENYEDRGESAQQGEEDSEEEEAEEEESEAAGEEEDDSNSGQSSKSEGEMSKGEESGDETEREEGEQSEGQEKEEGEEGETEEEEEKDEESGGEDEEEERESWDEGSEREVEDEEKTDGEEGQERESSIEEKTEAGEQSESDNENKNERSDEEEGESEEKDECQEEEEENETVEGEGEQEEKGEEESEEEDEVGNEEENQEEESDHEEEEENRDRAKEEEEEEENDEEEEGEEDKEEEVDEGENNEEMKDKKGGVTNKSEEEEEEESVREKEEQQNELEAEDEEKMSETDGDEDREKQEGREQIEEEDGEKEEDKKEGEIDTGEEKFREEENLDISETQETDRGDEDDEADKLNEMKQENNEEETGSEEEAEEEEIDQKEENKTTERSQRKQGETNEEEEEEGEEEVEEEEKEETEQKEKNIKTKKNSRKQRGTSEEEEEQEEESEEEEEETEQKEKNIKTKKNSRKQRGTSEEEEEQEEEMEEESEQEEKNIKTEKNRRKMRETSEEEEEQEEESEEQEEEETEQKEKNIKTKKNSRKQRGTSEEEEEQEEEMEEEEEETEQKEKNIKTKKNSRKQSGTSEEEEEQEEEMEEEEEESEQEEKNLKTEKNRRKMKETSEEEEEQEEESEEQEEEETEQKENNIKLEKIRRKQRKTSKEEEEQGEGDEEEEEEEETERKEKNTKKDKHGSDEEEQEEEDDEEEEEETKQKEKNKKTEKNKRKQRETSEEEEEQEEEGEEEEEEETEQKEKNIKTEKNERKQRETNEEEEEQEEEGEEEEEEGEEEEGEEEEEEGEEEEEEEEEEKTKKVLKHRAKRDVLPPHRQTNAQRDRQKTRQRHQQNVKGKKQTESGAQDPQFWNNVLPQYLNLK